MKGFTTIKVTLDMRDLVQAQIDILNKVHSDYKEAINQKVVKATPWYHFFTSYVEDSKYTNKEIHDMFPDTYWYFLTLPFGSSIPNFTFRNTTNALADLSTLINLTKDGDSINIGEQLCSVLEALDYKK